jgi:hypothetical protein
MRRTMVIGLVVLAILAAVGIGVGAYNAGVSEGLQQSGQGAQVVRVVGPGYGPGFGFFPFGLILFPLFVIGIAVLVRGAFWRGRWGGPGSGPGGYGRPGPWGPGGPQRFEEWHRRQHEQSTDQASGRGEPTGT